MITKGNKVPDFTLEDKDSKEHRLSSVKTKYTIVYFYPKDNTPGCTIEAKKFSDALTQFEKLDVTVIGISGGSEKTKQTFCDKYNLKLILLSDPDFSVSTAFECYGKKKFMGREYMGIYRNTYLLDSNMNVLKVYEKVKPLFHVQELLDDIKDLEAR